MILHRCRIEPHCANNCLRCSQGKLEALLEMGTRGGGRSSWVRSPAELDALALFEETVLDWARPVAGVEVLELEDKAACVEVEGEDEPLEEEDEDWAAAGREVADEDVTDCPADVEVRPVERVFEV